LKVKLLHRLVVTLGAVGVRPRLHGCGDCFGPLIPDVVVCIDARGEEARRGEKIPFDRGGEAVGVEAISNASVAWDSIKAHREGGSEGKR
jgi:hypothetical protein